MILVPEGWYRCLNVPDDGDSDEYTANKLDTIHDNYKALSDEQKALVNIRVQFLAGKKVTLKLRPYLEVFNLSKLLVPSIQIQIDMYFNAPAVWTMWWHGADILRLTTRRECETHPSTSESGTLDLPINHF